MNNIINFNSRNRKEVETKKETITEKDILILFLIDKCNSDDAFDIFIDDIDLVMELFGKYRSVEKFSCLYQNLEEKKNSLGKNIIDFSPFCEELNKDGIIVQCSLSPKQIVVIKNEYLKSLANNYSEKIRKLFNELMFNINCDLKFGEGNWSILFEDEIVSVPNYPSFVTGEFIGQEDTKEVKKKKKERTIENLKNIGY